MTFGISHSLSVAPDRDSKRLVGAELRRLGITINGVISCSSEVHRQIRAICDDTYQLYVVLDVVIGVYDETRAPALRDRRSDGAAAKPSRLVYAAKSYGEADDCGSLQLTQSGVARLFVGLAGELVVRRLGLARLFATKCGFCGYRCISFASRCAARYTSRVVTCAACDRAYRLGELSYERGWYGVISVVLFSLFWLSGYLEAVMPLLIAFSFVCASELFFVLCSPQLPRYE